MITNIIATVVVALVTNTYAPKQHLEVYYYPTLPMQSEDRWVDGESWFESIPERDNPDVRIMEVHEVRTLTFTFEGRVFSEELSKRLVSSTTSRRKVTTEEEWIDDPLTICEGPGVATNMTMTNITAIGMTSWIDISNWTDISNCVVWYVGTNSANGASTIECTNCGAVVRRP